MEDVHARVEHGHRGARAVEAERDRLVGLHDRNARVEARPAQRVRVDGADARRPPQRRERLRSHLECDEGDAPVRPRDGVACGAELAAQRLAHGRDARALRRACRRRDPRLRLGRHGQRDQHGYASRLRGARGESRLDRPRSAGRSRGSRQAQRGAERETSDRVHPTPLRPILRIHFAESPFAPRVRQRRAGADLARRAELAERARELRSERGPSDDRPGLVAEAVLADGRRPAAGAPVLVEQQHPQPAARETRPAPPTPTTIAAYRSPPPGAPRRRSLGAARAHGATARAGPRGPARYARGHIGGAGRPAD